MIRRRPEPLDDGLPLSKLRSRPLCDLSTEIRSERHLDFIRGQRCCVPGCGVRPVHPHHRLTGRNMMGRTSDDTQAVPICVRHHDARSATGVHAYGSEAKWEEAFGVDLAKVARTLAAASVKAGRLKPEDLNKEAA